MSVAFDHRDPGTSEDAWARAAPWRSVAPLALDMRRLIVFAAHPDDESLGAGGLIAAAAAQGIPVSVTVMTDGEASHPESKTRPDIRRDRRREVLDAVSQLSPDCTVTFAGLADGGLREATSDVRRHVRATLEVDDPAATTVATTWWGDGHRDHRILGEIVREEADDRFHVVGYPIWLWHWADPADVDATDWCALPLDPAVRTRKAAALRRYPSQTSRLSDDAGDEPILHAGMLRHFDREAEVFVRSRPRRAPSVDRAWFEARYAERIDPWSVETRWYEQRKREVLMASLPRQRYRRVLEIGGGTGALTELLAHRADELIAVDVSPHALATAGLRLEGATNVRLVDADARTEWPTGTFDAVVLSEVAYYWDEPDLTRVLESIRTSAAPDGILVACHWRHPIPDAPQTGDEVHHGIERAKGLTRLVHHVEEDFVLDVFSHSPGALSVARETGILR